MKDDLLVSRQATLDRATELLSTSSAGELALRLGTVLTREALRDLLDDPTSFVASLRNMGAENFGVWKASQRICEAFESLPPLPAPEALDVRYRLDGNPPGTQLSDYHYDSRLVVGLERWGNDGAWYISTSPDQIWNAAEDGWVTDSGDKTPFLFPDLRSAHSAAQNIVERLRRSVAQDWSNRRSAQKAARDAGLGMPRTPSQTLADSSAFRAEQTSAPNKPYPPPRTFGIG